jgi:hypothetical protein
MIEVVYKHKEGESEPSFFVTAQKDGSANLHFKQGNRPTIAILNADEVRQFEDAINEHKE